MGMFAMFGTMAVLQGSGTTPVHEAFARHSADLQGSKQEAQQLLKVVRLDLLSARLRTPGLQVHLREQIGRVPEEAHCCQGHVDIRLRSEPLLKGS